MAAYEDGTAAPGTMLTAFPQVSRRGGRELGRVVGSTDAQGTWHGAFAELESAAVIEATKDSHYARALVPRHTPTTMMMTLRKRHTWKGQCEDRGGTPVAGVHILMSCGPLSEESTGLDQHGPGTAGAWSVFEAVSDGQGRFSVPDLNAGSYSVDVRHPYLVMTNPDVLAGGVLIPSEDVRFIFGEVMIAAIRPDAGRLTSFICDMRGVDEVGDTDVWRECSLFAASILKLWPESAVVSFVARQGQTMIDPYVEMTLVVGGNVFTERVAAVPASSFVKPQEFHVASLRQGGTAMVSFTQPDGSPVAFNRFFVKGSGALAELRLTELWPDVGFLLPAGVYSVVPMLPATEADFGSEEFTIADGAKVSMRLRLKQELHEVRVVPVTPYGDQLAAVRTIARRPDHQPVFTTRAKERGMWFPPGDRITLEIDAFGCKRATMELNTPLPSLMVVPVLMTENLTVN
jgi:hypothetical protein